MLPGLHPGLLMSNATIGFEDVPQQLYLSTGGGEGTRQLGLAVTVKNGVAPYTYEWEIALGEFVPVPASGSGVTSNPYVSFTVDVYVSGAVSDYREIGAGYLRVWDAAGNYAAVQVPAYAGQ